MIDLHSHLLYSVDDGASTLEESLALARIAVEDGINVAVMTPHIHPGRYDNRRSELESRVADFQQALQSAHIPLTVRLAGEVRVGPEALELLALGEIPFFGTVDGYRIMLLEFPHQLIPVGSVKLVEKLLAMKIRPLIAHPERNKSILSDPERIRPFVIAGCWLQLTAGSIAGRFGKPVQEASHYLLREDLAHVIASDAHNEDHRPPILSEGRAAAAEVVGADLAQQMVFDRPARLGIN